VTAFFSRPGRLDRRLGSAFGRDKRGLAESSLTSRLDGSAASAQASASINRDMTDQATTTEQPPAPAPTAIDPQARATELAILDALRAVVDPEIGMNVVELALIKQIIHGPDQTEVKMILTTPCCPYAGSMIQQVKEQVESVVEHDVKVTLLAERWDPRDAGLMW
jgi:metal-sulfur cluster biosynthetic enzyme